MKKIFEGIAYLFEEILLAPLNYLRELEADNWWLSNGFTWIAIAVLVVAIVYWMGKLKEFDASEDKTQTGHSFLK